MYAMFAVRQTRRPSERRHLSRELQPSSYFVLYHSLKDFKRERCKYLRVEIASSRTQKNCPQAGGSSNLRAVVFKCGTEAVDKPNYQLANRFHFFLSETGSLHYLFYGIAKLF